MAYNPNNNYPDESDKEGFLKELEWAYNICVNNEKSFYEQKILTLEYLIRCFGNF